MTPEHPLCPRCQTTSCVGPDDKSCSDQLLMAQAAELAQYQQMFKETPSLNLMKENADLTQQVAQLQREVNEADRRAGAAERHCVRLVEEKSARTQWLDKAKEQWGVDRNVSFDVIWKECLDLKADRDRLVKAVQDFITAER